MILGSWSGGGLGSSLFFVRGDRYGRRRCREQKEKNAKKHPTQLKEKHTSLALQLKPLKKIPPD